MKRSQGFTIVEVLVIVAVVAIGCGLFLLQRAVNDHASSGHPTPNVAASEASPSAKATVGGWHDVTVELYRFKITIPASWSLKEFNRHPAPIVDGSRFQDHDCAEYLITDAPGAIKLTLSPICSYYDTIGMPLPKDGTIIKRLSDMSYIARYKDAYTGKVIYANGRPEKESTAQYGTRTINYIGATVTVANRRDLGAVLVSLEAGNTMVPVNSYLPIIDKIVSSLQPI